MKRIIALMLLLAMCLSLVACGGNSAAEAPAAVAAAGNLAGSGAGWYYFDLNGIWNLQGAGFNTEGTVPGSVYSFLLDKHRSHSNQNRFFCFAIPF